MPENLKLSLTDTSASDMAEVLCYLSHWIERGIIRVVPGEGDGVDVQMLNQATNEYDIPCGSICVEA